MSEEYKNDRKWSDKIFYDSAKSEILKSLNLSQLFGIVTNIEPASQEDDNNYNIDTYINKIPTQVRLQRFSEKKDDNYYPTLRYGRPYDTSTEVRKMIKMYDSYLKTGNHKMPKYLLWGMIDEKNKLVEIKLISSIGNSSRVNSFTTGSSDSEGNSCLASSIRSFTSCTASSFEYSTGNSRII